MISPSENTASVPNEFLGSVLNINSVLPLEFKALEPLRGARRSSLSEDENRAEIVAARLREELAALDRRLESQSQLISAQLEEARRLAKLEAHQEWEPRLEERLALERQSLAATCAEFAKQRTDYFNAIEGEVVRLSLAIASRVLHRETKLDPLLLAATVRVALDKITEESEVTLHVPASDVDRWQMLFAERSEPRVNIVGLDHMVTGDCILETSMGKVELGVVTQLEEIERGFFDLLQQRPA